MKLTGMIKKADIVLLILLILLGLASLLILRMGNTAGESVRITVDGELYGTYPLSVDRVIEVQTEYGNNQVTISGGAASVTYSDCQNHDCEGFGAISSPKQTIICIPHRLIITVTGRSDIDAVVS